MNLKNENDFEISSDFIILGCGYVGSFFLQKNPKSFYTNRLKNLSNPRKINQIYFDLKNNDSWQNIPSSKNILWTFPAANNEIEIKDALLFFNTYLKEKRVIILSSTSAYSVNFENEIIHENSNILLNNPRFYAEEKLREQGAIVLHLSGIIGPNRTPLNWYKNNLIRHEENILNYIHVCDIIYFIEKLFYKFTPYKRFNLSSQDYKSHIEISHKLIEMGLLEKYFAFYNEIKLKNSKKISSSKILDYLEENNYKFKKYPEDIAHVS